MHGFITIQSKDRQEREKNIFGRHQRAQFLIAIVTTPVKNS